MGARSYRNRIKELRWVRAGDLVPHEKNWRQHPEVQEKTLRGLLEKVGWAGAVLARATPDGGLQIVDGHLRASLDPETLVPVLVTDLDEKEGETMLLATDPLAMLAEADQDLLADLLSNADTDIAGMPDLVALLQTQFMTMSLPPVTDEFSRARADGGAGGEPGSAGGDSAAAPPSDIRVVQLYMTQGTLDEFQDLERRLRVVHASNNVTETVLAVMRASAPSDENPDA